MNGYILAGQPAFDRLRASGVEHARQDLCLGFNHREVPVQLGHGVQDDEADKAGPNEHRPGRSLRFRYHLFCVFDRPEGVHAFLVNAGNRRTLGRRAGRDEQGIKRVA